MKNLEKWEHDYIQNINLENIEWVKLKADELRQFFKDNYLDKDICTYVLDAKNNSLCPTPLGMHYLNINCPSNLNKYNFLLGIVDNNIKKKTIVACLIYLDKYFLFTDQIEPLTYFSTVEVNSYFRNLGIYRKLCKALFNFINQEQSILISQQSELGIKCKTYETLKSTANDIGFTKYILEDNYKFNEFRDLLCQDSKVLKKIKGN